MTEPGFFSPQWAAAVRDVLAAGPSERERDGKLPMYWDFFDKVKAGYASSWALGCRDLPAGIDAGPAYLHVHWGGGTVTGCHIAGPGEQQATYVLGMDYADWQALHGGYDAQRTVMYRKILVEEGNVLEFFKGIYFFTECLGLIGKVPADFTALAVRLAALIYPGREGSMRIGLTGAGSTADRLVEQARRAEADGFTSMWYPSAAGAGDPLAAMTLAGRATSAIELGTAVLVSYSAHPVFQASRANAVVSAIGTPGRFTLGVGPSHRVVVADRLGLSYDTPGQHTDEYVQILAGLLRGEQVSFAGQEFRVEAGPLPLPDGAEIPVLVGALGTRLLRVAGSHTAGTILWMANATAIEQHVAPVIRKAAADAGRPAPRIVAGLPVAVHDNVAEARSVAARQFAAYGHLPNYQRILSHGRITAPAEAAIVGDEDSVARQVLALFEAGATDVWAAPFPVGDDAPASRTRTRALLASLARN